MNLLLTLLRRLVYLSTLLYFTLQVCSFWGNIARPMMHTRDEPFVLSETDSYLVIYKPPGLATAPLKAGEQNNLLFWCIKRFPEVGMISGKKPIEGGLLHRLDTDTNGLVLFARTQAAYDSLLIQQDRGDFIKRYHAWCKRCKDEEIGSLSGFPPPPYTLDEALQMPLTISSPFRPYGPGRKQVRPVLLGPALLSKHKEIALDHEKPYITILRSVERDDNNPSIYMFDVEITRGFRHQIRCHLAWFGFPIIGDPLYNPQCRQENCERRLLALQAWAFEFLDPLTGNPVRYELSSSTETGGMV